jgi:anti-sigma factor RsiW
MNPCRENILIGRYHDGELDEPRRELIKIHLASCPACLADLVELRRVSNLLTNIPLDAMTPNEHMRVYRVVDGLGMRLAERSVLRMAWGLTALAATLLVVTSLWLAGVQRDVDAPQTNGPAVAILLPRQSDQSSANLSHWMVRNLGGDLP